jgi:hypothetical protein
LTAGELFDRMIDDNKNAGPPRIWFASNDQKREAERFDETPESLIVL